MASLWSGQGYLKPAFLPIRYVLLLLIACSATGCEDHEFKNEQAFTAYVAKLGLTHLTLPAAITRVTAQGFSCHVQKNEHYYCVREINQLVCKQKQVINLTAATTQQDPLQVSSVFGWVCL